MLKKIITYTNFNDGSEITEEFHFHLSQEELMEMQVTTVGGLAEQIRRIVASQDYPEIYKIFKNIVRKAYGVKSPDGKRFMKEDYNGRKLYKDFEETEAFSKLIVELATNDKAAAEFINGITPANMNKQIAAANN